MRQLVWAVVVVAAVAALAGDVAWWVERDAHREDIQRQRAAEQILQRDLDMKLGQMTKNYGEHLKEHTEEINRLSAEFKATLEGSKAMREAQARYSEDLSKLFAPIIEHLNKSEDGMELAKQTNEKRRELALRLAGEMRRLANQP
jgi:hypothetical protein